MYKWLTFRNILLINILIGALWFFSFPISQEFDWPDIAMELAYLTGFLAALYFALRTRIPLLKIGMILFMFSLLIEVYDEFTVESLFWKKRLPTTLAIVGLMGTAIGIKLLVIRRDEDLLVIEETSKALEESEQKYKDIFESFVDVYYRTDKDMRIDIVSPSVQEMGGYDPADLLGKKAHDLYYDPLERDSFMAALEKHGAVSDFEMKLRKNNGDPITVSANVRILYGEKGTVLGLEGVLRDITLRKEMDVALQEAKTDLEKRVEKRTAELREVKENFQNMFNNTSDALFIQDKDKNILDLNLGAEMLFGYKKDELIGHPEIKLADLDKTDQEKADVLLHLALDGIPQFVEWVGKKKDGTSFEEEVLINKTEYNGQDALLITIRDVTQRKKLEAKAQKRLNDLQRFQKLTVGREIKMVELKKEIQKLKTDSVLNPKS